MDLLQLLVGIRQVIFHVVSSRLQRRRTKVGFGLLVSLDIVKLVIIYGHFGQLLTQSMSLLVVRWLDRFKACSIEELLLITYVNLARGSSSRDDIIGGYTLSNIQLGRWTLYNLII